jgi:tetratricopeptide (TPR) repeat protein
MLKPHLRQADALVEVGDWAGAEAAYRHALALRPFHPATRNNLGRLYMQLGRFKEAETQFRELLEVSPDIVQARLNWASIMRRDGRWLGAERLYREALTYGDTRGEVEKKLGFIALQFRGDAGEAVRLYRAGIARQPEANSWTALGVALRRLPSDKEAEIAYAEALQLEPNHADAWFNLGNLYRDTERLEMARQAYARVVELADEALAQRARNELHLLTPQ